MRPRGVELDVSDLPTAVFGSRDLVWWGTLGFMVIEGFSLLLCIFSAFYLRRNFETWPPAGTPRPALLIPTINSVLLLLVIVPMYLASKAAQRWEKVRMRNWLIVAVLLTGVIIVLRGFEFAALGTTWDSTAYGSIAWLTLGFHSTLIIADFFETMVLAIFVSRPVVEDKLFVDTVNNALYSYYLPLSYIPLYAVLFLWPGLG